MNVLRNRFLAGFVCFLFISLGHADHAEYLANIFKSVYSAYVIAAGKNVQAAKSITELLKAHDSQRETSRSISSFMDKTHQYHEEIVTELHAKFPALIHSISNEKIQINFLDMRLSDALVMLESVKISPLLTLDLLQKMREIAVHAMSGTCSSTELFHLNERFQGYIWTIHYAQSIGLIDGIKTVAGGELSIKFGDDNESDAQWSLEIPPIDPQSLNITHLDVLSQANAQSALDILDKAVDTTIEAITITSIPAIADAEAMLINIPYMLYQNFDFMISMRDLTLQAMNETYSDNARALMNIEFEYLKSAMQKNQTWVSLYGPIMTGKGKITLQIGQNDLPENKLEIQLPSTDIHLLGMDKLAITSIAATIETFSVILNRMKAFIYYPYLS